MQHVSLCLSRLPSPPMCETDLSILEGVPELHFRLEVVWNAVQDLLSKFRSEELLDAMFFLHASFARALRMMSVHELLSTIHQHDGLLQHGAPTSGAADFRRTVEFEWSSRIRTVSNRSSSEQRADLPANQMVRESIKYNKKNHPEILLGCCARAPQVPQCIFLLSTRLQPLQ
jgi:hypothetical protein